MANLICGPPSALILWRFLIPASRPGLFTGDPSGLLDFSDINGVHFNFVIRDKISAIFGAVSPGASGMPSEP
jgi:hypothetical protein